MNNYEWHKYNPITNLVLIIIMNNYEWHKYNTIINLVLIIIMNNYEWHKCNPIINLVLIIIMNNYEWHKYNPIPIRDVIILIILQFHSTELLVINSNWSYFLNIVFLNNLLKPNSVSSSRPSASNWSWLVGIVAALPSFWIGFDQRVIWAVPLDLINGVKVILKSKLKAESPHIKLFLNFVIFKFKKWQ